MNRALNDDLPWAWRLPSGCVQRIGATGSSRWLRVDDGLVWLTATQGTLGEHPDVWLSRGESVRLPAATQWVIEGQGPARYTLLQGPAPAPDRTVWSWLISIVTSRSVCAY